MVVSAAQSAKRALVKLLITVAAMYSVILEGFSREAGDKEVQKVYRKVLLRVHPDKGGSKEGGGGGTASIGIAMHKPVRGRILMPKGPNLTLLTLPV